MHHILAAFFFRVLTLSYVPHNVCPSNSHWVDAHNRLYLCQNSISATWSTRVRMEERNTGSSRLTSALVPWPAVCCNATGRRTSKEVQSDAWVFSLVRASQSWRFGRRVNVKSFVHLSSRRSMHLFGDASKQVESTARCSGSLGGLLSASSSLFFSAVALISLCKPSPLSRQTHT